MAKPTNMAPTPVPGSKAATNRRRDAVLLAHAGLSQKWIAHELGVSQAAVSKMLARAVRNGEFNGQGPHVLGVDVKVRGSHAATINPEQEIIDPKADLRVVRQLRRRRSSAP